MKVKDKKVKEEVIIEYFTDKMHKEIFAFQDKISKNSKPSTTTISFKTGKRK
jgi:hypothetical protein